MNKIFIILFFIINNFLFAQNSKNFITDICGSDSSRFTKLNNITGIHLKLFIDKTEIETSDSKVSLAVKMFWPLSKDSILYIRKYQHMGFNMNFFDEPFQIIILNCRTNEKFILLENASYRDPLDLIELENYYNDFCFDFNDLVSLKIADSCFKADKNLKALVGRENMNYGKYSIQVIYSSDYSVKGRERMKYFKGPLYSNIIDINYLKK